MTISRACARDRAVRRHFVQILDEYRAFGFEVFHDELVVDDFVAHVDRRAVKLERALDDLDRAIDAGAETTGLGENDVHGKPLTEGLAIIPAGARSPARR
jgi:hypothetical protein